MPQLPNGKIDVHWLRREHGATVRGARRVVVAPRTETERRIAAIFQRVLDRPSVGVNEDFFDLGGDSLQAMELLSELESELKLRVPFHRVAQGISVAALARHRDEFVPWSPLVTLRDAGQTPALFLAAPAGGNVLCYFELAKAMQFGHTIYGLQPPGIDNDLPPLESVDATAECYLETILRTQPEGPYLLAGWSFGALVAYEMASRLEQMGRQVAFLGMIDSALRYAFRMVDSLVSKSGTGLCGILSRPVDEQFAFFRETTKIAQIIPPQANPEMSRRIFRVCVQNIRSALEYRPPLYTGSLTLLEAREKLTRTRETIEQEWRPLCGHIHRHLVPGNHFTLMNRPHVLELAAAIDRCLPHEALK
jgi:thioesterase domain-containing protein/acyl carrier protein